VPNPNVWTNLLASFTLSDATAFYLGYSYMFFVALVIIANFSYLGHKIFHRIKTRNLLREKRRLNRYAKAKLKLLNGSMGSIKPLVQAENKP